MVDIRGRSGGFLSDDYNLEILSKINLKLVSKRNLIYSNRLAEYILTDDVFKL